MKETSRREIRAMSEQTLADYLPLAEAAAAKGMSKERFLKWCQERNIRHIKRSNRWWIHKLDLVTAIQQDKAP